MENLIDIGLAFLNSPLGITLVASLVLLILNQIYGKRPGWEKYEGVITSAIKFAEKKIPDDTSNKAVRKFDLALKYFIKVYSKAKGKSPNKKLLEKVGEGIHLTHNRLEKEGTLKKDEK